MTLMLQRTSKYNIKEDKKISIAIMSSFAILTIQYLILTYFNLTGTPIADKIQLISKIFVGFFYLIALPAVLRRNKVKFISVYFISIFIFLLNYIFFIENHIYLYSIIFPYFFTCLPSLIYSYSINDWNVLKDIMKKISFLVFITGSVIGILVFNNKVSIGAYSMSLSYYMLLPTIVYLNELLEKFNAKSIIIVIISLIIILVLGSRGAIMCIGVFTILKVINTKEKLTYKMILTYLLIIFLIGTVLLFLETILENLYDLLLNFGIYSRSISLLLKDTMYLSGRDYLYEEIIEEIKNNPIFGIGLVGDRQVTSGRYVHNIIIEIMGNFGIIIGSLIVLLLGFISFRTLFSNDKRISSLISIWFSIGLVHLMVSSSYLIDFKFWIFLGLGIRAIKNNLKYEV